MATEQEKNKDNADQLRNIRQRESFNNAYAALAGQQSVQSFTAFTFEEAVDQNIEAIEGVDSEIHPNQLKRVERIKGNLIKAIEEIRQLDPADFRLSDSTQDVNTPENGE